jgi:hypothetical protein
MGAPSHPYHHSRRTKRYDLEDFPPDTGCAVSPKCVECPLPLCRYEVPGGIGELTRSPRDEDIRTLRQQGASVAELMERSGLSRRTVFRILAKSPTD